MTFTESIEKAKEELSRANYIKETTSNRGLYTVYSEKAEWLSNLIFLAEENYRLAERR